MRKLQELDVKTVRLGLAGLAAVALLVVLIVVISGDDDSPTGAVALSESDLRERGTAGGTPVYWLGARAGVESYELTSTTDGRTYVRYLTDGAEAGDPRPNFVTVGTYQMPDAQAALQTAADANPTARLVRRPGFTALRSDGNSAYVVFTDQPDIQVEIFSPNPGEAASLVTANVLQPLQ